MIIVRETFDLLNEAALGWWRAIDYISDAIYLIDIGIHFITSKWHFTSHNNRTACN